jgi:hypothetical protein
MANAAADRADIERVIQLYVDATRRGDAAKMKLAFHKDAHMFGSFGGARLDVPIAELFAMSDGKPADVNGSYKAQIVSVEQVGDAATATLEEQGFWGAVSFTDFFSLIRADGAWKIVSKTFAHTGGAPPKT